MSLMNWDAKKYDVLVPQMNDQHHRLIDLMNKVYDRHAARATKAELNQLLMNLRQYTIQHFDQEERMLESIGYPQLDRHKIIHEQLLTDFGKHYDAFAAGSGAISQKFFDFLKLWLTSHILHIDRKYGEFAAEQDAA